MQKQIDLNTVNVVANNGNTMVVVLDQPDPNAGGACHEYAVTDAAGNVLGQVNVTVTF